MRFPEDLSEVLCIDPSKMGGYDEWKVLLKNVIIVEREKSRKLYEDLNNQLRVKRGIPSIKQELIKQRDEVLDYMKTLNNAEAIFMK